MEQINNRKKEFHGSKNKNGIDKHKPAIIPDRQTGSSHLCPIQHNHCSRYHNDSTIHRSHARQTSTTAKSTPTLIKETNK